MFSIKDCERTNKARELSYHSDERFFKDLSNGHVVFVFKFMNLAGINVFYSQLPNFFGAWLWAIYSHHWMRSQITK